MPCAHWWTHASCLAGVKMDIANRSSWDMFVLLGFSTRPALEPVLFVVLFYGSIIFMYLQTAKSCSHEQVKFMVLFYTVFMPTLNLLIYSLRNKDLQVALGHLLLGPCSTSGCGARE
ncbi:Olfactory receptor 2C3 [Heterocephalus glaber]|uniref:Olfactory receptor 2C3 n=1 Tax=Heterocephalus glaber TaxID=10181 RepID=G5AL09_HETGA|nr:Olfactory receptor 2C3 [Heterocephalus glaber]